MDSHLIQGHQTLGMTTTNAHDEHDWIKTRLDIYQRVILQNFAISLHGTH